MRNYLFPAITLNFCVINMYVMNRNREKEQPYLTCFRDHMPNICHINFIQGLYMDKQDEPYERNLIKGFTI